MRVKRGCCAWIGYYDGVVSMTRRGLFWGYSFDWEYDCDS